MLARDVKDMEDPKFMDKVGPAHREVLQKACDGELLIWGKRTDQSRGPFVEINSDYWENHELEHWNLIGGNFEELQTSRIGVAPGPIYEELRTNKARVEELWPNYVDIEQAIDHVMGFLFPDRDKSHQDYQREIPTACKKLVEKFRNGELVALGKRTEYYKHLQKYKPHSTDSNRIFDKKDWEYRELIPTASMVPHDKGPQTTSSGSDEDHIQLTALKVDLNTVKTLWPVENT